MRRTYGAAVAVAGGAAVAGTRSTAAVTLHGDGSVLGWVVELVLEWLEKRDGVETLFELLV